MVDLDYLAESFPRICSLKGKKILIKFGGNLINEKENLERFSKDIALLVSLGLKPIIVHGGGPDISRVMKARGLTVRKVAGLRITDDETLKVVKEVLSEINENIVKHLRATGIKAIGMSGSEGNTIICSKTEPVEVVEDGNSVRVDLGKVGEVKSVNPSTISLLCTSGFVPVIYPICCDEHGNELNVNADTVAAHIAKALGCEEMVMVTDVPGLMRENGNGDTIISELSVSQVDELIRKGVITGGMIPKVQACKLAIVNGVKRAHMVNGRMPHSILNQLLKGSNCGTTVTVN